MKEYTQDEKDKTVAFLKQCIRLVQDGITEYKNNTDTLVLYFCSRKKDSNVE